MQKMREKDEERGIIEYNQRESASNNGEEAGKITASGRWILSKLSEEPDFFFTKSASSSDSSRV